MTFAAKKEPRMQTFLQRHGSEIKGVLSGFDRLRFMGTMRLLANVAGLQKFLNFRSVLLKDFTAWAKGLTDTIKTSTEKLAAEAGRPVVYLPSSQESKEEKAREIAERDGVREGLVCAFKCVEPCYSMTVGPNAATKRLELRRQLVKCSHYYFYLRHPRFGPLNVRLQSWMPFTVHVCLNGRDWLARSLRAAGMSYEMRDNCFTQLGDVAEAQRLMDRQLRTDWAGALDRLLGQVHPAHSSAMFGEEHPCYYWSAQETEWATDVMFRSPESLAALFPGWKRHAITNFASQDVLRFLGRRPEVRRHRKSEIVSVLQERPEGTCVKHRANGNGVKMYDKQAQVLRVETLVVNPHDMKVFRRKEGSKRGPKSWLPLRKSVADLHRRAEISQKANERYLNSLAATDHPEPLGETVRDLCRPAATRDGRRVRALQPLHAADMQLLQAVSNGKFALGGFRNRDLRSLLYPQPTTPEDAKRQAAKVTRHLRMLRAHGLIIKIAHTHRYQLTSRGRTSLTAILAAQQASTKQLTQMAA